MHETLQYLINDRENVYQIIKLQIGIKNEILRFPEK